MPLTPPANFLDWVTSGDVTKVVDPGGAKKALGWLASEKPAPQYFNWLLNTTDQWLKYLNSVVSGLKSQYDIIIGGAGIAGATDATLAAALAAAYGPGMRVLLADNQDLTGPVQLTKNYWKITALPGVTYNAANGTAVLQLAAQGIELQGLRMTGFTTAIQVQAAGVFCRVANCSFYGCTNELDDSAAVAGKKPAAYGNISEI